MITNHAPEVSFVPHMQTHRKGVKYPLGQLDVGKQQTAAVSETLVTNILK